MIQFIQFLFFFLIYQTQSKIIEYQYQPQKEKTEILCTHYNEITPIRFTVYLSNKNTGLQYNENVTEYRINIFLGDKIRTNLTLTSPTESFRPHIHCNRETIIVLSGGTMYLIEPQMAMVYKYTQNIADKESPFTFQKRDYPEVNDVEYLFFCKDNNLVVMSGSSFGMKTQPQQIKCGEHITAGEKNVFMKRGKEVVILDTTTQGIVSIKQTINFENMNGIGELIKQSETFVNDTMIANRHDSLYVQISDKNRMIVLDKQDEYQKYAEISLPFYEDGETQFYNPLKAHNFAVYGNMIAVGIWSYKKGRGMVRIYFDNRMSGYSPRFEVIESSEGSFEGQFFGYSVGINYQSFLVGGKMNFNEKDLSPQWNEIMLQSKGILNSCNERVCECIHGYYYVDNSTTCSIDIPKNYTLVYVLIGVVVFLAILFSIVIIISIVIIKIKRKKDKPKTYRLEGSDRDYTFNELFPFKFEPEDLCFGANKVQLEINVSYNDILRIKNPTKKKLRFRIEIPESYRFKITTSFTEGELGRRSVIEIPFEITMLCTCKTDEYITVVSINKDGKEKFARVPLLIESAASQFIDYQEVITDTLIGEGGFGGVFKGDYRGQMIAVKLSKKKLSEKAKEQFDQEIQIYSSIRNEYIIQYIGSCNQPEHTMMLMEYAPYESVKKAYPQKQFSDILAIKVLLDCAHGMKYLHANNIIHRDLKPDNLLLFSFSAKVEIAAKISDFGTSINTLSKRYKQSISILNKNKINESNFIESYTQSIQQNEGKEKMVGTPAYIAPEIIYGEVFDVSMDVFSYAIMMLELLTRKFPYPEDTFKQSWDITNFISKGHRPSIPKSIPNEIASFIILCWDQNPKNRPTFMEIEQAMQQYFDSFEI